MAISILFRSQKGLLDNFFVRSLVLTGGLPPPRPAALAEGLRPPRPPHVVGSGVRRRPRFSSATKIFVGDHDFRRQPGFSSSSSSLSKNISPSSRKNNLRRRGRTSSSSLRTINRRRRGRTFLRRRGRTIFFVEDDASSSSLRTINCHRQGGGKFLRRRGGGTFPRR